MGMMIWLVILMLGIVTGLLLSRTFKKRAEAQEESHNQYETGEGYRFGHWLALGVAGLAGVGLLITLLVTSIYSQDPGEARVVKSFTGQIVGTNTNAGLGVKAPWDDLIEYNTRNQVVTYAGNGEGHTGPAITAQDMDGATATIDIVVRYSIDPKRIEEIYREYGTQDNFVSRVVQNDVRSEIRNIPLRYHTSEFRNKRAEAAKEMQLALATKWEKQGVLVEAVDLRDIKYPESIEQSLQRVQEARNNASKAQADLETAKVSAEKTRVDAQAQADADQIIRCGAKSEVVTEKINGIDTRITKVTPNSNEACQNRLNEQVLTSKYIEALKEMAAKGNVVVVPQGSTPMVQVPTPTHK